MECQAGKGVDAERESRPRPTRSREGSDGARAVISGSFYWGVLVKGLHTAGGTPRLPPRPGRLLRHGDPRGHMSITGYRNSRDSVGRPALLGLARKPGRAVHLSARQIHAWYGIVTTLFCWTCEVYYARAVLVCLILFRTFAPFCGVLVFWAFSYNVPAFVVPCFSPSRLLC